MKKLFSLLVAVLVIFGTTTLLSSCGDDEPDNINDDIEFNGGNGGNNDNTGNGDNNGSGNNTGNGESDSSDEAKDELSNTSWKVSSFTGWGADAYDDFKGMELRFNNKGGVTEWYSSDESFSGKYSVSGRTVNLNDIPLTYQFGSNYDFTISGSKLTLVSDKGKKRETSIIFTKK